MQKLTKIAAVLVLAATAAAPVLAAPETFVADSTHTFSRFSYSHFGYSTQLSRFDKTTGTITLDKAAKTGAVDVVIDMKSVDTGYDTFNEHIQGEDFLDTAKYPTATFKSTKVSFDGDKPATIDGELTIKGVTKPTTLDVKVNKVGDHPMAGAPAVGFDAKTMIKRSEFGLGKYAPNVSDDVKVAITVEAVGEKKAK